MKRSICTWVLGLSIYLASSNSALALSPTIVSTPFPTIEYSLPFPGLLPDHTLYPLKLMRDRIVLLFTRDTVKRSNLYLLFADKHLVMGQLLWEKKRADLTADSFQTAETHLLTAVVELVPLKKEEKIPPGTLDKIELAAKKHEEILNVIRMTASADDAFLLLNQALEINHKASEQIALLK